MRIWIDARKAGYKNCLWFFIRRIINNLEENKNKYIVFVSEKSDFVSENNNVKVLKTNLWDSLKHEIKMWKLLKKQKLDDCIFFDAWKPINYNKLHSIFPWAFEKIVYSDWVWTLTSMLIKRKLKKADKIICFTKAQKDHLLENIDLNDEKIEISWPGFLNKKLKDDWLEIKWNYIVCDSSWDEKLIKKAILGALEVKWLKVLILGDNDYKTRFLQNFVIDENLSKKVFFSPLQDSSKIKKAKAFIYTPDSEIFPYTLENAVFNNIPILAPKNSRAKDILWKNALYFSSLRQSSITELLSSNMDMPVYKEKIKTSQIKI